MAAAGLMIVTPFLLMGAALVVMALGSFRLLPRGVGAVSATFLVAATGSGLLLLGDTYGSLVSRPAKLQERYLGRAVAGPLRLRGFQQFGFQDPGEIWRYDLPPDVLIGLRRRCVPDPHLRNRCSLGGEMDDRYYASVLLEDDRLRIDQGLW